MSNHFSTLDGVPERTKNKHCSDSLKPTVFEMAVYLILLWDIFAIAKCPPLHVS
jgi:hypothetical protein